MPKPPGLEAAIEHGLAFLGKCQEADGSFISFSSRSMRPFRRLRSWQTTFVPALMLASLSGLDTRAAMAIRDKLAGFLLKQKDANGAFNYWAKNAPERKTQPYPNDLDDTFCALTALYLHDPDIIDGAVLAQAVKLLLATEMNVGGPYRTWLVPADSEPAWLDVDVAVNSNIAYFLSLVSNGLPVLDELVGRAIATDSFSSPYYPSVYAFIYYFARSYRGPHQTRLLRKARRLHKAAVTDLDRALCLCARLCLGETQDLAAEARHIASGQKRDGSWAAAAFYADPVKNQKPYYNGAPALTTAFVLEALQLYIQSRPRSATAALDRRVASRYPLTRTTVLSLAKRQCRPLPTDLRLKTMRSLKTLAASSNGAEIISLPQHFNQSLLRPGRAAPEAYLDHLSLANLWGWLAYTIYDDFLDNEGRADLLPVANVAMRNSLSGFLGAEPVSGFFTSLVRQTFDTIDGANAWELAHCRYERQQDEILIGKLPDYGDLSQLAERSLGHTLAPLAILATGNQDGDSTAFQHTRQALAGYLIVRQLNDDLHDWQADLANGQVTYVVTRILLGMRIRPGKYQLSDLLTKGRQKFWHDTLPEICYEMRLHITASRQALDQTAIFKNRNVISRLLDGLEVSVEDTLAQQGRAGKFLGYYGRKAGNV